MGVDRIDVAIRTGINHDGTYRQAEVDRIDAAVLAEELAEIYSTTPKGWPEPKKVIDLYLIDCVFLQ